MHTIPSATSAVSQICIQTERETTAAMLDLTVLLSAVTHLLTLRSLEVHVAVALSALGRSPQLAQPMCLCCLGEPYVPERSSGDGNLRFHPVHA